MKALNRFDYCGDRTEVIRGQEGTLDHQQIRAEREKRKERKTKEGPKNKGGKPTQVRSKLEQGNRSHFT
jgi:hypothetical protein